MTTWRRNKDLHNITQKTKDRATRAPLKTRSRLRCSGRVCSSYSTCGTLVLLLIHTRWQHLYSMYITSWTWLSWSMVLTKSLVIWPFDFKLQKYLDESLGTETICKCRWIIKPFMSAYFHFSLDLRYRSKFEKIAKFHNRNCLPFSRTQEFTPGFLEGSVLLNLLALCGAISCVFTFWVQWCDVRYDFHIKTMFDSSLHPVVVGLMS